MKQISRNLTDACDGFLIGSKYVLMDRDTKFTQSFRATLKTSGAVPVLLPPQSPNLNAYIERFMGSIKSECLDRMILFNETQLRNAIQEYLAHYHGERNHQGLDNQLIEPLDEASDPEGVVVCRQRLGGMLRYYHRRAA